MWPGSNPRFACDAPPTVRGRRRVHEPALRALPAQEVSLVVDVVDGLRQIETLHCPHRRIKAQPNTP